MKDAIPLSEVRRALLIKLRQLGDVLLTTPAITVLKKNFPQMQLDALIYEEARPLLAHNPAITSIYSVDRRWKRLPIFERIRKELNLVRTLRRNRYDLVINLTEGDRGAIAAIISGARWRVGRHEEHNAGFIGKPLVFTHLYRVREERRHIVEQHLDALRRIGLRIQMSYEPLHLNIPNAAKQTALTKLRACGWADEPYIVLSPTSRCVYKCLPPQTVADAIHILYEQGHRVVLTCGPHINEINMVCDILARTQSPVFSLKGNLDLLELGAIIEGAYAFLGSDSLPMHMAAALQIPTVVWFGPLQDVVWGPWLVPHRIVAMAIGCRPCGCEGCGDGMVAECLMNLKAEDIVSNLWELLPRTSRVYCTQVRQDVIVGRESNANLDLC